MKPWLIVVAAIVPGGSLLLLAAWAWKRWMTVTDTKIDTLIVPPSFRPGMEKQNDSLRVKTEARRKAAASMRTRAAHVESGAPVCDLLRRVK